MARVMIIDDDRDTRDVLADLLRAAGHDVWRAGDAIEAMRTVEERGVAPDAIVLDMTMPVGGAAFLQARRYHPLLSVAPVIVYSGRPAGLETLPDVFERIAKPAPASAVLDALARALAQGRREPAGAEH
jgi:DNA-binding NtrC family response regulator